MSGTRLIWDSFCDRIVGDEVAVPGASYVGVGDRFEVDPRRGQAQLLVQDLLLAGLVGLRGAVDDGRRPSLDGLVCCPVEVAGGLDQTVGLRVGQRGRGPVPPAEEVDEVIRPGLSPRGVWCIQDLRPAVIDSVALPVILGYDDVAVVRPDLLDDGDMSVWPDDGLIVVRVPLRHRSHGRGVVDREAVFLSALRPVRCVNRQGGLRDTVDRRFDEGHVVGAVGIHAVRRRVLVGGHAPIRLEVFILEAVGCIRGDGAQVRLAGHTVAGPAFTQRSRVGGRNPRGGNGESCSVRDRPGVRRGRKRDPHRRAQQHGRNCSQRLALHVLSFLNPATGGIPSAGGHQDRGDLAGTDTRQP